MIHWGDPILTVVLGGGYLGLLTLLWVGLVRGIGRYGARWRLPEEDPVPATGPGISICIPARNEAGNIGPCVQAALASTWSPLEVLVVDDHSDDGTAEEARAAAPDDPRLHILPGRMRPPGWSGKAWAVSQAAANAAYEHLLFIDADVQIAPGAVTAAMRWMQEHRLDLLSLFGTWRLESFWERAVIPPVGWLIRGAVNLDAVNDPARPDAFANGQFILVRRRPYEDLGGHGSVRAEVLDDVRLGQKFKVGSHRVGLLYAPWAFRVRLYRSLRQIVDGYTKNFYEGMGRAPHVALGLVLFIVVGTLLPFLLVIGTLAAWLLWGWMLMDPPWLAWCAAICGLVFVFRFRLERGEGRNGLHALTHPLGNLLLIWIVLRSMLAVDVEWKGRRFRDGKVAGGDGTAT